MLYDYIQNQFYSDGTINNPKLNIQNKQINVAGVLDHRILMSAAILSLVTGIKANLKNFEQVRSSCPNFLSTINTLGGRFEIKKS